MRRQGLRYHRTAPPAPAPPSAPRQYGSGHGVPDIHTGHDRRDCWRYRDLRVRVPHNVFFTQQAGAPADIDGANANVSITRAFATAGTYTYTCHIHPSMQGTVVVR